MDEQGVGSTEVTGEEAKAKVLANIVRGTIPHPLVYLIRFEEGDAKDADVAKKYGTTTGKVADIRKNRNFGYIDEAYAPTQAAKDAAIAWLKRVPGYDEVGTDAAVIAVDGMRVASEGDLAAFQAKRAATRAKTESAGGGSEAASGNPVRAKGGKKDKGEKKVADAADLMA